MPYTLHEDNLARDARWMTLAGLTEPMTDLLDLTPARRRTVLARLRLKRDQLQSAFFRMSLETAAQKDDGYLTLSAALACCDDEPWILKALTTPACGKPPFLHRRGDACAARNCIDESPPWVDGFDYRICAFLKRNPSRKEVERNQAQKKDLNDPVLRSVVYARWGGCCAFCRSGPMKPRGMGRARDRRRVAVIAHIDPDRDAGPDYANTVLGCAYCNEYQGRRTPDEAGMVLLPPPGPELVAYWQQRGEQQFERLQPGETDHPADHIPGANEPTDRAVDKAVDKPVDEPSTNLSTSLSTGLSSSVPSLVRGLVGMPPSRPVSAGERREQAVDEPPEGSTSGRVGSGRAPPISGLNGQPIRAPDAPDIYHRRSRPPPGAAAC